MQTQGEGTTATSRTLASVRWLLVVALAVAVVLHAIMAVREFSVADQAASFYLINIAVDLVPALVYAAAVGFVLVGRGTRVAWSALFAGGLALAVISGFYLVTAGFGELMLPPVCLVALSLLQLWSLSSTRVAETG